MAGQPTVQLADGCTTKTSGVNGAGLWLFTRERVGNPSMIQEMRSYLKNMGIATSELNNVTQAGCPYKDAYIKE